MRTWIFFCFPLLIFLGLNPVFASFVPIRDDVTDERPVIQVLRHDQNQIQIEVKLSGINLLEGTLEGRHWDRVEIPGGGFELDLGAPEVPHFTRLLAIPSTVGVRAEFKLLESKTLPDIDLMPAQGLDPQDLVKTPQITHLDPEVYSENTFYPQEVVTVGDPALMRGMRFIPIQMNPVQYNPVTKELRIAHRFQVTIHFEGTDLRNVPSRAMLPISRSWKKLLGSSVLNLDEVDIDETIVGSYLIVCEDNDDLVNNILPPLIDWKTRKGHIVVIETFTSGASVYDIKAIIQDAYDNWEVPPEFVLLYGGVSGDYTLPGYNAYSLKIDHPYSQLEGDDILADVAIGRLPAHDAYEAVTMRNKTLYYEKTPYISNDEWYHQGCLTAGASISGLSTVQTNRWIKTRMIWNEFTRIDTFWYWMPGSVATTIVNAVNDGVVYVNHRGYGLGNLTHAMIEELTNTFMLPFVTMITCLTGGFSSGSQPTYIEHFVMVGTPITPKGAVAAIGTATTDTHTRYNNTVNIGIYAGIFDEGITQAGNALNRGKLELYNTYHINDPWSVENFSNWNALAGDPGLELFTGAIQYMTSDVPSEMIWGENTINLTVHETGIGPLEDATVCLYGEGELHEVGLTDGSGQLTLPLNLNSPGNVKVTITKQNFYPIIDSLDVVQIDVAVGYFDHSIDDDVNGSSSGDNDGTINPGESVEIPLIFKNYGSSTTATGISVTASLSDEFATLVDGYETFPNLAPSATGNSEDDFDLSITADCPHGHLINLVLETNSNQGSWDGAIDLQVISYTMSILSAYAAGGDTMLSPGETADFILDVTNEGGKTASSLTAIIMSLDPHATVNDNFAAFGTIAVGERANCSSDPFNLTAADNAPPGHLVDLEVTFTSSTGAMQTDTLTIQLGAKSIADPQGPDEYGYYCFDNLDWDYPISPVYDWIEIDPRYGGYGTPLPINDPGYEQDMSADVALPFTFRYYGETINEITVCSNGWISTWPNISFNDFRNYPIPSSVGPNGMIAAFWDDLVTGPGRVYSLYDSLNYRFIVEWSRLKNQGNWNAQETFEIILFDPEYHPTPTGDGEILFLYHTIEEVYGSGSDNPYSTVGIERPDQQDGIEVVYWNTYEDPAAAHLANERAYLFTTNFEYGGDPPIIGVDPSSLTISVPQSGYSSEQLTISNSGGTTLAYDVSLTYNGSCSDGSGGPDNFGYTWIDSDEPGGPVYNWIDISIIGTPITFVHNDSTTTEMLIGFNFPFYGQDFTEYIVSANGWISFSSHSGAYSNTSLPSTQAPFDLVAGFWDDLDPLQSGDIFSWNNDVDSLVVSFLEVPHYSGSVTGTYTFQMILTADGTITYQYATLIGNYESFTVGIQNSDGTDGLQVAYNLPYLHDGLSVKFYHPFLRAEPVRGMVPAGGDIDVNITAYSYGMEPGTYDAILGIDSNDPVTPHVDVPLTINIGGVPGAIEVTMEPYNPPIVIPSSGGSFNFTCTLENVSGSTQVIDFWIMAEVPNGTPYGPILLRQNLALPVGVSITRNLMQTVPGGAPGGDYYYYGIAGVYPDSVIAEDGFVFTKEAGENGGQSFGEWLIFGWEDPISEIPAEFAFNGCHPNPFNPPTRLHFDLPVATHVEIIIYDMLGRRVEVLQDGVMNAGSHAVQWPASNAASGVYIYRFIAEDFTASGKMVLMK